MTTRDGRHFATSRTKLSILMALMLMLPSGAARSQTRTPAVSALGPIESAEKNGTAFHVSLKDITKLALQNNLDIAISNTSEELYAKKVLQAYGPYDPAITVTLGAQSSILPNTNMTNQSSVGATNTTTSDSWKIQFAQNLPTGGGVQAILNSNRSDTNQQFALFSPQYSASATIQFLQPLLRNRRIDQIRGTIQLANLDVKISDSQFKQTVTNTVGGIQGVYWDLVGAIGDYDIKRDSVKLAQVSVENNREKVRIGVLASIEITVAEADMANRQVDLLRSQQAIHVAQNNLRAMVSADRNAEIWQRTLVPTDVPDFIEYKTTLDEAIESALQHRPELEQINFATRQNEISYDVTSNLKKWQVDLVGSFGTVGVGGPQTINPETGQPMINQSLVGGAGTAYRTLLTEGFRNWFAGFNIQIPLRNRNLEGQLGQLQVQKRQLLMNRRNVEQKMVVQVRNAYQDLETNKQRVETAKLARQLAEDQLQGESKRFQAGLSENFLLLQRQRDLSAAQGAELQSLIAYRKSIIALEQAMYTLLEENDFVIAGSAAGTQ
jgi:outer membrane protein